MVGGLLFYFLVFITAFSFLFIVCDTFYFYLLKVKELGKPPILYSNFQESSLFYKIFRDFPRLLGRYFYERKNCFEDFGIIIFYGPQGCGKTMAVTHWAQKMFCKYPKCWIGSNYGLLIEDFKIKNFKNLITEKNPIEEQPIIFCYDELNNWANSRDWQKMPKNILADLCYQRKNKRLVLATGQSISQIDKQIRIQCASGEYRRCFCWLHFIHCVIRLRPEFDSEGNMKKKHFKGVYFFLQDEVLRYLYDTTYVIDVLREDEKK